MLFFLDTAETAEIKKWMQSGLVDGVTTNPSLIMKSGRSFAEVALEICKTVAGKPVSLEVSAEDYETMMKQAKTLIEYGKDFDNNVVIKVPLTVDGLRTCKELSDNGTPVNVTLCFSAGQALLAAKAGAAYISPFVGRLDDIGADGMELIRQIKAIYDNYGFETKVLAASIRTVNHVIDAALAGADVSTMPTNVLQQLYHHVLTDKGLRQFADDWAKSKQIIAA
jgi:transaldolase